MAKARRGSSLSPSWSRPSNSQGNLWSHSPHDSEVQRRDQRTNGLLCPQGQDPRSSPLPPSLNQAPRYLGEQPGQASCVSETRSAQASQGHSVTCARLTLHLGSCSGCAVGAAPPSPQAPPAAQRCRFSLPLLGLDSPGSPEPPFMLLLVSALPLSRVPTLPPGSCSLSCLFPQISTPSPAVSLDVQSGGQRPPGSQVPTCPQLIS